MFQAPGPLSQVLTALQDASRPLNSLQSLHHGQGRFHVGPSKRGSMTRKTAGDEIPYREFMEIISFCTLTPHKIDTETRGRRFLQSCLAIEYLVISSCHWLFEFNIVALSRYHLIPPSEGTWGWRLGRQCEYVELIKMFKVCWWTPRCFCI